MNFMDVSELLCLLADAGLSARLTSGNKELVTRHVSCGDVREHLYINTSTGCFYCHHCQAKGGPFALLTEVCGLEPFDAWRKLPAIFQASKDKQPRYLPKESVDVEASLPEDFIPDLGKGLAARYLESRGLSAKLCRQFGLGYCLQGKYARRVVVPVHTEGKLRTFVARAWSADVQPKVLTAEGSHAGSALFNFDAVRPPACILVEGVFDAMRIPKVAIATLGLHTSERQRNLLRDRGFTDVVLLRDADEAGQEAAAREAFELAASFFKVWIAPLSPGKDPASSSVKEVIVALDEARPISADSSWNLILRGK